MLRSPPHPARPSAGAVTAADWHRRGSGAATGIVVLPAASLRAYPFLILGRPTARVAVLNISPICVRDYFLLLLCLVD